jgi:hypothetical protein
MDSPEQTAKCGRKKHTTRNLPTVILFLSNTKPVDRVYILREYMLHIGKAIYPKRFDFASIFVPRKSLFDYEVNYRWVKYSDEPT